MKALGDACLGFLAGFVITTGASSYLSLDSMMAGALMFVVGLFAICSFGWNLFTGKVCYSIGKGPKYLGFLLVVWLSNFAGAAAGGGLIRLTRLEGVVERAQALYDEAVRVDESYRAYSEELLAAWGLTLAGTPIAGEAPAYSGGARGSARKERSEPEPEERRDEYELLRDQLSRIPGLTGMNRAALVRDWYDAGRLSYQSMQRLLAEIG